jgi:hypothetical protein
MLNLPGSKRWYPGLILAMAFFLPFGAAVPTTWADERLYALNL